jgi:hypothetical protein
MFKNKTSLKLRLQRINEAEISGRQVNNIYDIFCSLLVKTSAFNVKNTGKAMVATSHFTFHINLMHTYNMSNIIRGNFSNSSITAGSIHPLPHTPSWLSA